MGSYEPRSAESLEGVDLAVDPLPGPSFHSLMDAAREVAPVVRATFYGAPALLITRYAEVRLYLSMQEEFPGGDFYRGGIEPVVGPTFISMDGIEHDVYRRLATPAFRSRVTQRFVEAEIAPLAHDVIDRLAPLGEADLAAELARVLPFRAISRKLGLPVGSEQAQREWALRMLSYPADPDGALAAAAAVDELVAPVVRERRRQPGDDVISELLRAQHGGRWLGDDEICAHVRLLYAVGATTTSDAMSSMLHRLLTEPGVLEAVAADPQARPRMVQEALRTEPSVALLPRTAARGGILAGHEVPPGSLVLCGIASANRDRRVFPDAHAFRLDRRDPEILTFGFGSKYCPGSHLARHQLLAVLTALVERLPDLRLVEATEPANAVLRRVDRLVASWDPSSLPGKARE
jgi:cytochrome P450